MRLLIILLLLLSANSTSFGDDYVPPPDAPQSGNAVTTSLRAVQKYPEVSILIKNSETWAWNQTKIVGLTKDNVIPIAVIAAPLVEHKLSTKDIQMGWYPEKDVEVRPDMDYYFNNSEFKVILSVKWRF
jgi:hypothetical protein